MYSAVPISIPATVRLLLAGDVRAELGDAEVDELEDRLGPLVRDEHVLGLQVAVGDAERVRRLERVEDLAA